MKTKSLAGVVGTALVAMALLALAAPAAAQTGGVRGKVVDESGKPVQDAVIVLDNPDGLPGANLKTDAKGEFFRIGMRPGDYSVKATKGNLSASLRSVHIGIGDPTVVETLTIRAGGAALGAGGDVDKAALAKKQAELQNTFKEARAFMDAGKFDEAIAAYTKVTDQVQKCAQCFVALGDAYSKKGDLAGAEASYKKAIEAEPTSPEGYAAASTFYNTQRKFEEASQMSAKAMELSAAKGTSDPLAVYNQGIILWNQNKYAEAQAQFQKAVELDPKMADAHYWYGMSLLNAGKLPESGKEMQEYLKLAPTGQHAEQAKSIVAMIK